MLDMCDWMENNWLCDTHTHSHTHRKLVKRYDILAMTMRWSHSLSFQSNANV